MTDHPVELSPLAKRPRRDVYLLWSLLKKDKNDWVLQKCTEIGVGHFMPVLTSRTEKTGFDVERANKIVIEAAEQCGRSDIPTVHDVQDLRQAIESLKDHVPVYVCDERSEEAIIHDGPVAVVIGPEGGWDEAEIEWFMAQKLHHVVLGSLTLRAETASVVASSKLLA
jgi:16S rRNA (uracil1498-N3)-methyltransferase